MEYRKGAHVGGESLGIGCTQQYQPVVGIASSSSGTDSLSTLPSLPAGQGFYTVESLQVIPPSSSQTSLQYFQQDIYPPGTSYGGYGLAQQQPVMPSEEITPPGTYELIQQQQQHGMPPDLSVTAVSYASIMQQQGIPYGLMQQGNPDEQSISMYSDPVLGQAAHGSYGLGHQGQETMSTQSDLAPGSMLPLHYPIDHRVGHFPAQQAYAAWIRDDSHNQFPAGCPINPSFPDPLQSGGAIEGFQDGQWPLKREPIREYVGQPLSYRGFGAPSRSENLSQVWRPGLNDTRRKLMSPFKGNRRMFTPKKYKTMKTSKQNGPAGGVDGAGWCSVCQIDCITMEVLEQHKGGKKHNKHLQKQFENLEKGSEPMLFTNGLAETKRDQNELAMKSQAGQQQQQQADEKQILGGEAQSAVCESNIGKRKQKVKGTADDIAYKCKKLLDVGTSIKSVKVCSLCNVVCNSQTVFDAHLSGKKHVAQLKKLYEVGNPVLVAKNDAKKAAAGVNAGMNAD